MKYNNLYEIDERKQLIASELIILRTQKGYTQKEVAEKIDIKLGTYNAYEKARSEPPAEILVRLSFLYDVSIDEIVQKDNMLKDPKEIEKKLGEYQKAISELQTCLNNDEVNSKEVANEFIKLHEHFTKTLIETSKIMKDTQEDKE